jgi:hypothetical protein
MSWTTLDIRGHLIYIHSTSKESKMSHTPMCLWCDKQEIGSEIPSEMFCSDACLGEWEAVQAMDMDADEDGEEYFEDEDGDNLSDIEADADTLTSAGYGTDEDYGYFGDNEGMEW